MRKGRDRSATFWFLRGPLSWGEGRYLPVMSTEILYNGQCPVCSAEIAHYRRAADISGADLHFVDLNSAPLSDWGIDADQAARRLHARADGQIVSGLPAFVMLWQALPRWHWLARLVMLPGLRHVAGSLYDRVAAPILYRRHLARQKPRG
jgi:predicted DCC family thiol-disulfide oxidoreductase YuxK